MDFLHVTDCFKRGASIPDPIPHSVRRRKWVRQCVNLIDLTSVKQVNTIQIIKKETGRRVSIDLSEKLRKSCREFILFENQRRGILPPFSFSDSNLSRFERPAYSDEAGEALLWTDLAMLDSRPPPGFEWVSDWNLDTTYTQVVHYR